MEGLFDENSMLDGFASQAIASPPATYGDGSPAPGYGMGLPVTVSLDPILPTYTGGTSNYTADVTIMFVLLPCVGSTVLFLQMSCVRNDAIL
jgi:hypothetical protein